MRTGLSTIVIASLLLGQPHAVRAQQLPLPPPAAVAAGAPATEGSIEVGARGTHTEGDAARYERYRDLSTGAYSRLLFGKDTERYLFSAYAVNIGDRDQRYLARYLGGRFHFTGTFDSIPLNYSYISTTPWVEHSLGVLTLDPAARQLVQAKSVVGIPQSATELLTPSIYRDLAHPFVLASLRQTGAASGGVALSPDLSLDGMLSSTKRTGHQPWGASFAFNVANEVALPVNSRTNDASAGLEWVRPRGMVRVAYNGSWYDNNVKQLVWDNAYRATDTNPIDASGYSNGNGPAQGRMAVPPSNTLNAVTAMGLFKIRPRTTLNGTATLTEMTQNDPLIPWTINPVINTPATFAAFPNLAGLPRATAEAKVTGVNATLNFTTRPNRVFDLTARYRYNDHVNKTPGFNAVQYVRFDAVPEATGAISEQFDITENSLDVNAAFHVVPYTAFRVGYGYDSFDRTGRSFSSMTDNTLRASVDTVGNQWVMIRALYEHTKRLGSGFSEDAIEDGGAQPGLRFYDEADRDRDKGTLLFTINPTQLIDVTFLLAAASDTYKGPGHDFGLLDNNNTSINLGINLYPTAGISFGADIGRDHYVSNQKSRNANPPPDPTFNDPTRDWTMRNTENVNSAMVYLDLPKINRKTAAHMTYDYSDSDNGFLFGGPRIPALAALGQFIPLPNVTNKWQRIAGDVTYFFVRRVGMGVDYWYERFDDTDFATVDIPGQPGTPRIDYLGEISTGYGNRPYRGSTVVARLIFLF